MKREGGVHYIAEILGVGSLIISLVFVGFEMKHAREVSLAELFFDRNMMEHERTTAILQSEHALSVRAKTHKMGDWDNGEFTDLEKAAAEIDAHALWLEFMVAHRIITLGFETRDLSALQTDIRSIVGSNPAMIPVWK